MASIKLKFRPSTKQGREGVLYFRIIMDKSVRIINTRYRIYPTEWDKASNTIILNSPSKSRTTTLKAINSDIKRQIQRFGQLTHSGKKTIDEIVALLCGESTSEKGVFDFIRAECDRLKSLGRDRCSETLAATLKSFMKFRGGIDLSFRQMEDDLMEHYEAWMKQHGLTRNTTSFYMRNLRTAYHRAVEQNLTSDCNPFRKVYTGVDKTIKRAISLEKMRVIKNLDLTKRPALAFARDMLLFSFYARGMSFIDMASLTQKDIIGGYLTYRRRKTGQLLQIEYGHELRGIVAKYHTGTKYLLPILTDDGANQRRTYHNTMTTINRNLKKVGEMANLPIPLSMYVARHAWATIARDKGISVSVISEGLGHDNEQTTRIYLDSIRTARVDEAHRSILADLR